MRSKEDIEKGFMTVIGEEFHQAPIMLCEDHNMQLHNLLAKNCVPTDVAPGSPHIRVFEAIVTLALRALGSVEVVKFQCPVCALQRFDYIVKLFDVVVQHGKRDTMVEVDSQDCPSSGDAQDPGSGSGADAREGQQGQGPVNLLRH